jgi:hypothetical protein
MSLSRILANIGTALDSASTGDFLSKVDSDGVFGGVAYSSVTGTPTVLDSANVTNLIDSAYIQLRQSAVSGGGLDSAGVTAILDSDYITNITTASGFQMFEYDATAGQTEFTGSDVNGNTLAYSEYGLLVHYNGILLSGATDYTATDGTTVVLTDSADADARITIAKWSLASAGGGGGAAATWYGDRGLQGGGDNGSGHINVISYIDITTPGNTTDFGDLTVARDVLGGFSDTTYGLFAGGQGSSISVLYNTIDYVTIATPANATDFGDMSQAKRFTTGNSSNGTYGIMAGGRNSSGNVTDIDYVTVATPANATDFGDLTVARYGPTSFSDATYAVIAGGYGSSYDNTMDYITIDTPANATDFGDRTIDTYELGSVSHQTIGVMAGGQNALSRNVIDYVTTATPSNATDFGDLTVSGKCGGMGNATYGVWGSGSTRSTTMDYITIDTPANATDFGDNTHNYSSNGTCSGSPS